MKENKKLAISTAVALTAAVGSASAAITLTQTSGVNNISSASSSHSEAFDVQNAGAVLVVAVYVDGSQTPTTINTISFGGSPADGVINDPRGTLFYFLNPTVAASTIDFNLTGGAAATNGGGIYAWELGGVDLAAPVTSSTTGSITTTVADEFVVAFGWNNGGGNTTAGSAGNVGGFTSSDLTEDFEQSDGRGNAMAGASGSVASAGAVTYGWGAQDTGSPAAFSFKPAVIPEPSSVALLGLAGLATLCRRRK